MINFKSGMLSKKEQKEIISILVDIVDAHGDFYITKDNLRMTVRENTHILFNGLTKGDKIIWGKEGILFVHGFSDNANRKYVKILSKNESNACKLIKILNWNLTKLDLYAKVKKDNPVSIALQKNGFKFSGDRGKELLLCRKSKRDNFKEKKIEGEK